MAGEVDNIRRLRHDLANPLGALLTEVQLLLLHGGQSLDAETAETLRRIEGLARQMKDILAASRQST